jgi:hypothetical protein
MKTENIIRIVQTVLVAAVAAFAISVVVAGHWWASPPPPPPPPPPVDVQGVGKQVTTLLQTQFDTADGLKDYGLKVDDGMTLINTDLNKYNGLATVHTRKGTQVFLAIDVWADPTGAMFYQPDGGSSARLAETASKEQEPQR